MDSTYDRIATARRLLHKQSGNVTPEIIVDGDIDATNIQSVFDAGATAVVCGRAIFGSPQIADNVHVLKMASKHAF